MFCFHSRDGIKSLLDYLFDLESVRIKVAHTVPVDPPKTEDN